MNDNNQNHSSNSTNGDLRKPHEAERFITALEADPRIADSLDSTDGEVFRFGAAVRDSAERDLPDHSDTLRELLIDKLDGNASNPPLVSKPSEKYSKNRSKVSAKNTTARIALAASLLLAVGLVAILAQPRYVREAARVAGEDTKVSESNDLMQLAESNAQDFRMEDRKTDEGLKYNVQVPVTESASKLMQQVSPGFGIEVPNSDIAAKGFTVDAPDNGIADLNRRVSQSGSREIETRQIDSSGIVELRQKSSGSLQPMITPPVVSKPENQLALIVPSDPNSNAASSSPGSDGRGGGGYGYGGAIPGGGVGGGSDGGEVVYDGNAPASDRLASASVVAGDLGETRGVKLALGRDANGQDSMNFGLHFSPHAEFEQRYYGKFVGGRGGDDLRPLGGEQYDPIHENSFVEAKGAQALSTFSIDVDTASYSNMRRFLNNNQLPPPHSIRIEELVNYFSYDYPQPNNNRPFSVNMELANCPWNEQHHLLRVGLKGKDVHRDERAASNLVFLLDVSGSMNSADKLPLLKQGLMMLVQRLSEDDSVSIVTYAGNAGVVLSPTNGANQRQIEKAIESLASGGSTNGSAGINLAYELAQQQFIENGSNRVILATDGDLNVGVTNDDALVKLIKEKASEGVFLTVLGFGTGNLKDSKLEKLADNGNGLYAYIDNLREAHKVLIDQMSGSLETIAKDVKIQIEFNPDEVSSYRLIGYENRVLAAQDFDNDRKDAGEIGAGHSVTALYEVVLTADAQTTAAPRPQALKYQTSKNQPPAIVESTREVTEHSGELLTLSLRYKQPAAQTSEKIQFTLKDEPKSFSSASADFQFAASVAAFGMILRNSQHRGTTSLNWIETTASRSIGNDVGGYRSEFIDLVRRVAAFR